MSNMTSSKRNKRGFVTKQPAVNGQIKQSRMAGSWDVSEVDTNEQETEYGWGSDAEVDRRGDWGINQPVAEIKWGVDPEAEHRDGWGTSDAIDDGVSNLDSTNIVSAEHRVRREHGLECLQDDWCGRVGVCLCTELNALDAEDGDKVAIIVKHIVNCEKSKPEKPKFKGVNSPAIVSVPEQASFSFEGAQNDEIHTPSENVDDNEPDAANSASSKLVSEHELFGQVCTAIFSSIDSITALEQQLADAKSRLTKQHDCMLWGFAESLDKLNVSLECKSATQSLDQYLSDVRHTLKMNSKTFNNTARPFLKEVIEQVGLDEMDEGQADVKVVIGGLKLSKKILSPYMEKVTKGVELDNKDGIASEQGVPSHYSSW